MPFLLAVWERGRENGDYRYDIRLVDRGMKVERTYSNGNRKAKSPLLFVPLPAAVRKCNQRWRWRLGWWQSLAGPGRMCEQCSPTKKLSKCTKFCAFNWSTILKNRGERYFILKLKVSQRRLFWSYLYCVQFSSWTRADFWFEKYLY